jgi:transcription-repair coupling factor (superfamily II helicase)
MIAELIDRYGDPPKEAIALVSIALLRGEATKANISEDLTKSGYLRPSVNRLRYEPYFSAVRKARIQRPRPD